MSKIKAPNLRTLCSVALLIAVEIALSRFCSISTPYVKIGFAFIPVVVCAMLFGPVWAGLAAALADFIGAILFPIGPYFPGFTLSAAIGGAAYGLLLYPSKRQKFFPNMLCAVLFNGIVKGLLINTLWLAMMSTTKTYWALLATRSMQELLMMVVQLVLLPILAGICIRLEKSGLASVRRRNRA